MKYALKPLHGQVIVITGASSGIGLATAYAAAERGAKLVLAARNEVVLPGIADEINEGGGQAIHVIADVGNRQDLERIAEAAIGRFGGFDTWVNNAGVSIYGRLREVTEEDSRQLFETNFWGVVNGSLIAADHLRERGGAIINIGSVLSDLAVPVQGIYSASKHAVKGFTDALRIELEEDKAPVSVTLIQPSGIDTPYPQHAKNYTDYEPTLPPPVYAPEEVAYAILHAAEHPERSIMVGGGGKAMSFFNKRAPGVMDWISENLMSDMQVKNKPAQHREGALYRPTHAGQVRGNYDGYVHKTSLYTRSVLNPLVTGAVLAAAGAAAYTLLGNKHKMKQQVQKAVDSLKK